MATTIDTLVVKLGLDTEDFKRGEKDLEQGLEKTRKSTEKVGSDVAANGKKASEFFGQLQKAALKFFAVLTVGRGMVDFTNMIITGGAQLDRMSTRLGTSADSLSRWQGAVRQSGGSAEGLLSTVQGLSGELTQIKQTGESALLPFLGQLGVSLVKTNGQAKSTVDILGDIGDALESKNWSNADKFNMLIGNGIDEGTANLLLKGAKERNRLLAEQKGYSDADAKAALKAQERWEGVKLQIERTSQKIVTDLIPAFERLTKSAADLADVSVPMLRDVYEWLEKIDVITGRWSSKLDNLIPKFKNPTLQKLFGGTTGTLASSNPLVVAAAVSENIRSGLDPEERRAIDRARDKVLSFFGNESAKKRVESGRESSASINPLKLFELQGPKAPGAASQPAPPRAGASRAERNNNPGNLEYRGQAGAVPEAGSGRFAKFESPTEGVTALAKQLQLYGQRGLDTINEIINKYAPAGENNTKAYIDNLTRRLGVAPDEELDLSNPQLLSDLIKGISRYESGSDFLRDEDVMTGISRAGVGGAQQPASVTIGEVKVYTQATDATGIARDMRGAIIRQADTGVR